MSARGEDSLLATWGFFLKQLLVGHGVQETQAQRCWRWQINAAFGTQTRSRLFFINLKLKLIQPPCCSGMSDCHSQIPNSEPQPSLPRLEG